MVLNQLRSRHGYNLSPEGYIFLQLVNGIGVVNILRQHFEFIALAVRNPASHTLDHPVILEIETTANQQFNCFPIGGQIFWQL